MPIYEYHCDACNKDFEELVFGDAVPPCPHCGASATHKLMSRCAFAAGGKEALPVRLAFGSLVIRKALDLSDQQTMLLIRESPYLQYFIGLTEFQNRLPFAVRSLRTFRQRIPAEAVNRAVRLLAQIEREDREEGQGE